MNWRDSAANLPARVREERLLRSAREYIRSAFPNPDREGCPRPDRLKALACDRVRPGDEVRELEHVVMCSPCFEEYGNIRTAWKRKRRITRGGLAVVLGLMLGAGIVLGRRAGPANPKPVEVAQAVQKRVLDLRPYESLRGGTTDQSQPALPPPTLDRANLLVTILLPIGSYQGRYVFTLVDSDGTARIETSVEAVIKNHVATAEARLDLTALPHGQFTLTARRVGAYATTSYPIQVR